MSHKEKILLLLVLLIVTAAFFPSLFNGFIKNDDPTHLLENPTLRSLSLENLRAMFQDIINITYIPLTTLSFAVEYHFFGFNPFVYHFNNLLLHLGVVVLVFIFLRRLGLSAMGATIGTLIFGIHPLRVESVAWVTERKDVLYAFFYMLAVLQYWDYAKSRKKKFYLLSLVCGSLSVLAKPMALSLPLILLLCDWWMGRKWKMNVLLEKIPFFLIAGMIAGITYLWNIRNPIQSVGEALLLWIWCFVFYIKKFVFPADLIIFYQYPQPFSLTNSHFVFSVAAFVLIIFFCWFFRKNRLFIFAILFYFFSIFFLLRFDDVQDINPVSDRFMYLPSVGFCALVGAVLAYFLEREEKWTITKKISAGFLGILTVIMFTATFQQCRIWRDGAILWSAVIKRSPNLVLAYVHRGAEYHEKGNLTLAAADYQKAIELQDNAYAHSNLATIYKEQKDFDRALVEYDKAVVLKPNYWGWYFDRGNLYREMGKFDLAIKDYTTTLQLWPGYAEAYGNRGLSYFSIQQDDLALADFNRAIRFDPRAVNPINNRAVLYIKRGNFDQAIKDFSFLIKLDPGNPVVYYNRGLAYRDMNEYNLALEDFNKALEVDPNYQAAYLRKIEMQRKNKI